jgi:hypothetical protein
MIAERRTAGPLERTRGIGLCKTPEREGETGLWKRGSSLFIV